MAFALEAGTHPGATRPAFDLGDDEVELGVGIHGERGRLPSALRDRPTSSSRCWSSRSSSDLALPRGSGVVAIVNGLGSAYPLELHVAARAVHRDGDRARARTSRASWSARTSRRSTCAACRSRSVPADDELLRSLGRPRPYPRSDLVRKPMNTCDPGPRPAVRPALGRPACSRPSPPQADQLGELDRKAGDGDFGQQPHLRLQTGAHRSWRPRADRSPTRDVADLPCPAASSAPAAPAARCSACSSGSSRAAPTGDEPDPRRARPGPGRRPGHHPALRQGRGRPQDHGRRAGAGRRRPDRRAGRPVRSARPPTRRSRARGRRPRSWPSAAGPAMSARSRRACPRPGRRGDGPHHRARLERPGGSRRCPPTATGSGSHGGVPSGHGGLRTRDLA